MLVRESISFERYKDPKAALGVGGEAQVKNAIDHIFREDDLIPLYHTIFGIDISPTSKNFTIQFYSDQFMTNDGRKLNKKNRAIELVKNAGIDEYFYDVDYNYKVRWWIVFKIKPEYRKFFKPVWIDGVDYRRSLRESVSFERYRDPKEALGLKLLKWEDLKPGYVLRSKVSFGRGDGGHIVRFNSFIQFYEDNYFVVTQVQELLNSKYEISFDVYDTLEDLRNKNNGEVGYGMYNINGTLRQFANKFDIIENIHESVSFERYRDPKKALGITTLDSIRDWMISSGHNVHPNNPEKQELQRYLSYAINDNKPEFVEYLLHIGVDPNGSPFKIAIRDDNFEIVKMLLDAGAQPRFDRDTNASKEMKEFIQKHRKNEYLKK